MFALSTFVVGNPRDILHSDTKSSLWLGLLLLACPADRSAYRVWRSLVDASCREAAYILVTDGMREGLLRHSVARAQQGPS
jgi:hypothetical protein